MFALGDVYTDWTKGVKASGGTVAAFPPDAQSAPANSEFHGRAAERYPVGWAPDYFGTPDFISGSGKFAYYLAPAAVQKFIGAGGLVGQTSIDAGADALTPEWAKQLKKVVTYAAIAGAVVYFGAPLLRAKLGGKR